MGSDDAVTRRPESEPVPEPVPDPEGGAVVRRAWFEQLSTDRFGVSVGERRIGFIDVDGPLHVALRGEAYETAIEVDRAIRFDQALRALLVA